MLFRNWLELELDESSCVTARAESYTGVKVVKGLRLARCLVEKYDVLIAAGVTRNQVELPEAVFAHAYL